MAVPIKLAIATWRIEDVCPSRSPPNPSTGTSSARQGPIPLDLQSPLRNEYYAHPDTRRNPRKADRGRPRLPRSAASGIRLSGPFLGMGRRCILFRLQGRFDEVEPVV